PRLSRDQVMRLQATLNDRGFDSGEVDGILGPATRDAIRSYQLSQGLIPDGFPDQTLLARLEIR
ncbi:MAG: peptidoglycan-binding protein, partial [Thioalkalivibrio sp.]|nr:peptidoglycan-binding protein [Thioalkalivibrio sp.]